MATWRISLVCAEAPGNALKAELAYWGSPSMSLVLHPHGHAIGDHTGFTEPFSGPGGVDRQGFAYLLDPGKQDSLERGTAVAGCSKLPATIMFPA
jgi:hypothetical protein